MATSLTDARPSTQPRLVAVQFCCGDPGTNPGDLDLIAGLAANPSTYFAATGEPARLDALITAGWKDHAFLWYNGRGGTAPAGMYPLDYPEAIAAYGSGVTCDPINEAQWAASIGNKNYQTSLIAALDTAGRRGACYPFSFYGGCALASSATDNATLDALVSVPAGVGGYAAFDVDMVCDYDNDMATPEIFGSNLKGWWSADYGVYSDAGVTLATNGQTVQQWNDRSGNNRHWKQATAGSRPTYTTGAYNTRPCLTFDGTADQMALDTELNLSAHAFTFCAVVKNGDTAATLVIVGGDAAVAMNINLNSTATAGRIQAFDGTNAASSNAVNPINGTGLHVVTATCDASNAKFYGNGTETDYAATTLTGMGFKRLGALSTPAVSVWFKGDMVEVFILDVVPTTNQRGLIHKYLSTKWGKAVSDTPTLPHKALVNRCPTSTGFEPIGESWERRDVTGIAAWPAKHSGMVAGVGRADTAIAAPSTWYTKPTILAAGGRSIVYIQSTDGTAAQKQALVLYYARLGYDVWIDLAGANPFTAPQIAQLKAQHAAAIGGASGLTHGAKVMRGAAMEARRL